MHYLKIVALGIIQGLSEFLPISSSGHLVIFQNFFGMESNNVSLEIVLHLGSLFAVLIYFRKDLLRLISNSFKFTDKSEEAVLARREVLFLLLATVVTGVLGLLFEETFEKIFSKPLLVCGMLLVTGVVLLLSDMVDREKLSAGEMGFGRALFIGIAQALAIIPGISRSGLTVCTSVFLGIKRADAARFSFLLSIPAIGGAFILKLDEISASVSLVDCLLGACFAFVSGYLVISVLLKMISAAKLKYFAYYCFCFSLVSFILILLGN